MSQDPTEHAEETSLLELVCRREGSPLTVQRRAVFESVSTRTDHPTAVQVHEDVQRRLPGVSRMTVYRALAWLVRLGVVAKVHHPDGVARFDPQTKRHDHIVCLRCGRLLDLSSPAFEALELPDIHPLGFRVTDYTVLLRGTCPHCQQASAAPRGAEAQARPRSGPNGRG